MAITADEILERKQLAENEREEWEWETKWEKWRRVAECAIDPEYKRGKRKYKRSALDDKFLWSLVQFVVAQEGSALLVPDPFATIVAAESGDIERAADMKHLIRYQMYVENFPYTGLCWNTGAAVYGTSILKVTWDFASNNPRFEHVPIECFYPSPDSMSPLNKDIPWAIHESWHRLDELEKKVDSDGKALYANLDKVKEALTSTTHQKSTAKGVSYPRYTAAEAKQIVHILDYWEDDFNMAVAEIKEGSKASAIPIIEGRPNPFEHERKPFVIIIDAPRLHNLYGIGIIESGYDSYREMITRKNQRIDAISQAINAGFAIDRTAGVEEDALINWDKGRIVRGNGPPAQWISALRPPEPSAAAYKEHEERRRELMDVTAGYTYSRGEAPARRETATAVASLISGANIRYRIKVFAKSCTGYVPLLALVSDLNQQYLPEEKQIMILGKEPRPLTIRREQIKGRYDFFAKTAAMDPEIMKEIKLQKLINIFQIAASAQVFGFDITKFLEIILKTADMPEIDACFPEKRRQEMLYQGSPLLMQQMMGATRGGLGGPAGPEQGTMQAELKRMAGESLGR
jgi:hypothetical protein